MATDESTAGNHANVYVERVEVRNFKGIESLSVDLSPGLTLLVGRNNAGKSRVLRALHVAVGREPAERDDLTVGLSDQAEIDVVIAPRPTVTEGDAPAPDEQKFDEALQGLFGTGLALVSINPDRQRFAWRTTVASVSDGRGARTQTSVLAVASTGEWQATNTSLPRAVRDLVYAELVDTRRDLDEELRRRGTPIRKILNDLQVAPSQRNQLEQELANLGDDILLHSETLKGLRNSLNSLDRYVDAIGDARVDPVPRTLEELARTVGVSFESGADPLASRLHGSGVRSLASLLAQDVFYSQTLGIDGGDIRPHPVTLIEEPESHLHPHAIVEVAGLLSTESRQVVATTHSPLLAMTVAPGSLRLIRRDSTGIHESVDFGPAEPSDDEAPRTKQPEFYASEMEKLKRLVERPFGELLFARAVVIGDGATERAFLPTVLRDALGPLAHGISVIDSAGMIDVVRANAKFARHVGIPLVVFADGDAAGKQSVTALVNEGLLVESSEVVWSGTRDREGSDPVRGGAIERMMISADREACVVACQSLNVSVEPGEDLLKVMKGLKGAIGAALAHEFVLRHPYSPDAGWPDPLQRLVQLLEPALDTVVGEGET